MNLYEKQKLTHRHRKQICYQGGKGGKKNWKYGINRYKLQNKDKHQEFTV